VRLRRHRVLVAFYVSHNSDTYWPRSYFAHSLTHLLPPVQLSQSSSSSRSCVFYNLTGLRSVQVFYTTYVNVQH
jgi:hypothetical protein